MSPVSRPLSPVSCLPCCKCFRFTVIDNDLATNTLNFERAFKVLKELISLYKIMVNGPGRGSVHSTLDIDSRSKNWGQSLIILTLTELSKSIVFAAVLWSKLAVLAVALSRLKTNFC